MNFSDFKVKGWSAPNRIEDFDEDLKIFFHLYQWHFFGEKMKVFEKADMEKYGGYICFPEECGEEKNVFYIERWVFNKWDITRAESGEDIKIGLVIDKVITGFDEKECEEEWKKRNKEMWDWVNYDLNEQNGVAISWIKKIIEWNKRFEHLGEKWFE